ncbi:hypothetical protein SFC66_12425 [Terribacillus saccharophilus]|uniref:hypothetical protein n=1 Tax=Terribacillus saccharophilus TaxID=361277 RepID=UPI0039825147
MQILKHYLNALKNLNKKYYFTPFLLIAYASIILQLWDGGRRFMLYSDKEAVDYVIFILTTFKAYFLMIIAIICYPHANFFIQSSWFYRKIFGTTWGVVKNGFSNYANIGKEVPNDYHLRSSSGATYTVSAGYKPKRERISDMQITYLLYLFFKFFIKDLVIRVFTHFGILVISPFLFLIAVPTLKKKGLLKSIEK